MAGVCRCQLIDFHCLVTTAKLLPYSVVFIPHPTGVSVSTLVTDIRSSSPPLSRACGEFNTFRFLFSIPHDLYSAYTIQSTESRYTDNSRYYVRMCSVVDVTWLVVECAAVYVVPELVVKQHLRE